LDLKELGQKIRQARERRGLSQEEFADLVKKDQTAISEYENGKRKIAAAELPNFSEVLRVPIAYFFGEEINADELDKLLLKEFHQLPEKSKVDAIEMLRILVKVAKTGI